MNESIRAFVAVELPADVKAELGNVIEHVRRSRVRGLRFVRVEGIHLTLKFLGNIPKAKVEQISAALYEAVALHDSFKVQLSKVGVFPSRNNPRVLWVGVQGALDLLNALQKDVDDALANLGFARETREFSPHLTIARLRDGTSPTDRRTAAETLFLSDIKSGLDIQVAQVSLIQSILNPEGAVYESLASAPLKGVSDKGLR